MKWTRAHIARMLPDQLGEPAIRTVTCTDAADLLIWVASAGVAVQRRKVWCQARRR